MSVLVVLIGMIAFIAGVGNCIIHAVKKKPIKRGLILMGAGLILFAVGGSFMPETQTSAGQKQTTISSTKKAENPAKKAQQKKEKKAAKLKAQQEKEKKAAELKAQQEKEKKAAELKAQQEKEKKAAELKAQQEKEKKAAELKAQQEKEAQQLSVADSLVSQAEAQQTRSAYEAAKTAVAGLQKTNDGLNSRLNAVNASITKQEQEAARQAEAQRQAAAAQQAEAQRQAAAAQQAEAQRQAEQEAQQAAQQNDQQTQIVYVAPQSGKKYHFDSNCRGLRNANQVISLTLQQAIEQGYTLCGFED